MTKIVLFFFLFCSQLQSKDIALVIGGGDQQDESWNNNLFASNIQNTANYFIKKGWDTYVIYGNNENTLPKLKLYNEVKYSPFTQNNINALFSKINSMNFSKDNDRLFVMLNTHGRKPKQYEVYSSEELLKFNGVANESQIIRIADQCYIGSDVIASFIIGMQNKVKNVALINYTCYSGYCLNDFSKYNGCLITSSNNANTDIPNFIDLIFYTLVKNEKIPLADYYKESSQYPSLVNLDHDASLMEGAASSLQYIPDKWYPVVKGTILENIDRSVANKDFSYDLEDVLKVFKSYLNSLSSDYFETTPTVKVVKQDNIVKVIPASTGGEKIILCAKKTISDYVKKLDDAISNFRKYDTLTWDINKKLENWNDLSDAGMKKKQDLYGQRDKAYNMRQKYVQESESSTNNLISLYLMFEKYAKNKNSNLASCYNFMLR